MDKYVCSFCGYTYDPQQGDANANVPADTPFSGLPEDWECPVCGVGRDMFEKEA